MFFPISSISSVSISAVVLQVPYKVAPYKKGIAVCWGLVSRSTGVVEAEVNMEVAVRWNSRYISYITFHLQYCTSESNLFTTQP